MHGNHVKHMLYGGAAIALALLAAGVPLGTALTYGVVLACPLMMIWMVLAMNGHEHGSDKADEPGTGTDADEARLRSHH